MDVKKIGLNGIVKFSKVENWYHKKAVIGSLS